MCWLNNTNKVHGLFGPNRVRKKFSKGRKCACPGGDQDAVMRGVSQRFCRTACGERERDNQWDVLDGVAREGVLLCPVGTTPACDKQAACAFFVLVKKNPIFQFQLQFFQVGFCLRLSHEHSTIL